MPESSGSNSPSQRLPKEPLIVAALIVVVSVVVAVGGIILKTRESLQRDKVDLLADANAKQVAPLRRVVQLRLNQDKSRLVQFAATRSSLGPGRARAFGDFAIVALLTPSKAGQWGLSWIEKGPLYSLLQSEKLMISQDQELALLRSLPFDRIREGDVYWQRLSDSAGRPLWAMAISVETQQVGAGSSPTTSSLPEGTDYQSVQVGTGGRAVVVGFFGRNPLLSATEDFIGSTSSAFVIDSRGYSATHSNKGMIGALLKDDPSVKEVFSARSSAGATSYLNNQGTRIFSAFEQVDRANLYVVMATPDTISASTGQSFGKTAVTTGALALLVGLVLVFAWGTRLLPRAGTVAAAGPNLSSDYAGIKTGELSPRTGEFGRPNAARIQRPEISQPLELPEEYKRKRTFGFGSSAPESAGAVSKEPSISAEAAALEKSAYVQRLVTGLEKTMKEPLLAAMAHVQLLKSKSTDKPDPELMTEIADHVTAVDRDLRRAKELIDKLGELSNQSTSSSGSETMELSKTLEMIAIREKTRLDSDGIELKIKIEETPLVRGRADAVTKAVQEVIENSRHALHGRPAKFIELSLKDAGESIILSITDNGVGMNRETRTQAFEPFFHEFDHPSARGLGLATVKSIVQGHGGNVDVTSSPGDGTTIILRWPVTAEARETFEKRAKPEPIADQTNTAPTASNHSGVDFSSEGAVALGGKVPLPATVLGDLPPPPRLGADDDDDDKWTFDQPGAELGVPEAIDAASEPLSETAVARSLEATEVVRPDSIPIRPIRRG